MMARPMFAMIVRTSAKSTLTTPLCWMRSLMPLTAWYRTSSALRKASTNVRSSPPSSDRSFWFGMVMSVSTCSVSICRPISARRARCLPSKAKGLVTTPTVRAPSSRATWAITGAAPVPVPPPMPAVMKTMSAPWMHSLMRCTSSSADLAASLRIRACSQATRDRLADRELGGRCAGIDAPAHRCSPR